MKTKSALTVDLARFFAILILPLLSWATQVSAESSVGQHMTVDGLVASNQLKIRVWVSPGQDIVTSQQVDLNIEVASTTWFAAGTKIARFEMQDAIVLRREKFAVNSSQVIDGVKWSTQLWTITIYPQRAGAFEIPALSVDVSIAKDTNSDTEPEDALRESDVNEPSQNAVIKGRLRTSVIHFDAKVPEEIAQLSARRQEPLFWLATRYFDVEQTYSRSLENVKAGDAIRRTITITADNVAAMMLPSLTLAQQAGLAVYHKPASLEDRINRGTYSAKRIETITYVVEKAGGYRLPPLFFYWWDLSSQSVQTIELPASLIAVGEGLVVVEPDTKNVPGLSRLIPTIMLLCFIGSLVGLAVVMHRKQRLPKWVFAAIKPKSFDDLNQELLAACRSNDGNKVITLLYAMLDKSPESGSFRQLFAQPLHARAADLKALHTHVGFERLMAELYANKDESSTQGTDFSKYEPLLADISKLLLPDKTSKWPLSMQSKVNAHGEEDLKLN